MFPSVTDGQLPFSPPYYKKAARKDSRRKNNSVFSCSAGSTTGSASAIDAAANVGGAAQSAAVAMLTNHKRVRGAPVTSASRTRATQSLNAAIAFLAANSQSVSSKEAADENGGNDVGASQYLRVLSDTAAGSVNLVIESDEKLEKYANLVQDTSTAQQKQQQPQSQLKSHHFNRHQLNNDLHHHTHHYRKSSCGNSGTSSVSSSISKECGGGDSAAFVTRSDSDLNFDAHSLASSSTPKTRSFFSHSRFKSFFRIKSAMAVAANKHNRYPHHQQQQPVWPDRQKESVSGEARDLGTSSTPLAIPLSSSSSAIGASSASSAPSVTAQGRVAFHFTGASSVDSERGDDGAVFLRSDCVGDADNSDQIGSNQSHHQTEHRFTGVSSGVGGERQTEHACSNASATSSTSVQFAQDLVRSMISENGAAMLFSSSTNQRLDAIDEVEEDEFQQRQLQRRHQQQQQQEGKWQQHEQAEELEGVMMNETHVIMRRDEMDTDSSNCHTNKFHRSSL